jgi:hypothetical protein
MSNQRIHPTPAQQALLDGLQIQLIHDQASLQQWDQWIRTHHYLHDATLVGQCLRYVALAPNGQWVALVGWSSAAYHLKARDRWLGWSAEQRRRRLQLVAQNSRFLILPQAQCPNLASRVLSLVCRRLKEDWLHVHGHGVVLAESFIDPQFYQGSCYQAAGWRKLGRTAGFARAGRDYFEAHDRPKDLWVLPLCDDPPRVLAAASLPEAYAAWEAQPPPQSALPCEQLQCLGDVFREVPDFRTRSGRRHRLDTLLAIAAAAVLAGARTYADISGVADDLSQPQLRRLRAWYNRKTQRYQPPCETTFWLVLTGLDAAALDRKVGQWLLAQQASPLAVAIDGKCVRNGHLHLFAAFVHGTQSVISQMAIPDKTNEIPCTRQLLRDLPLDGVIVTADALHTQSATVQHLVQDRGADYLIGVRANQPTVLEQCQRLLPKPDFSPGTHHHREGPRAD